MSVVIAVALFFFGAVIASFVGVVAARLYTGQSMFRGRSRCDACNAPLSPFALVPILSYIAGGGKTLCCGARLSYIAPISEALLGALFSLSYLQLGLTLSLPFVLAALSLLLALVLYDLAHQILPPSLLTAFVVVSVFVALLSSGSLIVFSDTAFAALLIAGCLLLIHALSRGRAMGLSDAPLALGLALLVGPAALPGFIFSFWIGAVIGIFILFSRPRGSRMGIEVPFAPFLAVGFILAYFTQWSLTTFFTWIP